MVTERACVAGKRLEWFFGANRWRLRAVGLSAVLTAAVLLCAVAVAQPKPAADDAEAAEPAEPAPPPKQAQAYEQLPVDDNLKTRDAAKINQILLAGRFAGGEQDLFDQFYQKYFLSRWTVPKYKASLHLFRKDLRVSHLAKKSSGGVEVHDHLNALVLDFMKKLVAGRYDPAVQVNAMLTIGELNSVELPAAPLPEALGVMLAAVANAKVSDAVRTEAMFGIQRHVAMRMAARDLDDETRKTLTAAMLKVTAAELPTGSARAGREWILAQAVETLGHLGSTGENNAVLKALVRIVGDSSLSLSTRSIAAVAIGRLTYGGVAGINPAQASAAIAQFAADACSEELRAPKDNERGISRRRTKQRLGAALLALVGGEDAAKKGIASAAQDAGQKANLTELRKAIEVVTKLLDDKNHESDDLESPLDDLRGNLEEWLKKQPK
jgi:hypothetical protein